MENFFFARPGPLVPRGPVAIDHVHNRTMEGTTRIIVINDRRRI